jgi:periplasmic copper chaperone A
MTMYQPSRLFARAAAMAGTAGLVALLGAGIASAHVTAQPGTAVKGSTGEIVFRVPDEDAHAGTVKLEMNLPLDHPIASVSTKPVPGWTAQATKVKLDKPIKTDDGTEVTDAVGTVTWTAQPGTRIEPGQFQEFPILASTMPDNTDKLVMSATQTYDNGQVVRWDQPPAAPGAPEPEHPAPTVTLTANTTAQAGMPGMGATASPASTRQATQPMTGQDNTARWLAGGAVGLGALGLGVAAGALLRVRNGRSS